MDTADIKKHAESNILMKDVKTLLVIEKHVFSDTPRSASFSENLVNGANASILPRVILRICLKKK